MDKKRAIALGTFDGLHLGHRRVLEGTKQFEFAPAALLFTEHPAKALCGSAPAQLLTDEMRDRLLESVGIEALKINFREIMALSARDFFTEILLKRFCAGAICCGENYTFGKGRLGTPALLHSARLFLQRGFGDFCKTAKSNRQTHCSAGGFPMRLRSCTVTNAAERLIFRPSISSFRRILLCRNTVFTHRRSIWTACITPP